jgi:HEAT repeat protein
MSFFRKLREALGLASSTPGAREEKGTGLLSGLLRIPDSERNKSTIRGIKERKEVASLGTLLDFLDDPDDTVREEATIALYGLGRDALPALPAVLRRLQDPAARVRRWATSALAPGSMNPPTEEVVPHLVARFLEDPDASVRREVISILSSHLSSRSAPLLPVVAPTFLGALRDPSPEVRRQAAYNVGSSHAFFCADDRHRKLLAAALEALVVDPDREVRTRVATALPRFDPASAAPLPVLQDMLLQPGDRPHLVSDAAEALRKIEGDAPRQLLLALLQGPDLALRARAAFALQPPHDHQDLALAAMVEVFHTGASKLRVELLTLLQLRPLEKHEREALRGPALRLLDGSPLEVQKGALRLLCLIGVDHPEVIQRVVELTRSPDSELRQEAAESLGRVCKDAAVGVPVLRIALQDRDEGVGREASRALGWFGEPAAPAVPELLALLHRGESAYTKTTILYALGSIGPAAKEAIPPLIALLGSPQGPLREGAAEALARLKAGPALLEGTTPAIIEEGLASGTYTRKNQLLRAVATCGEEGGRFARGAGACLAAPEPWLVENAVAALDAFGASSAAAVPAMLAALPTLEERSLLRLLRLLGKLQEHLADREEETFLRLLRQSPPPRVRRLLPELSALGPRGTLALLEATQNQDETLCLLAMEALRKQGAASVPALERALRHPDPTLRLRAVGALAELGEAAKPALRGALDHEDELIRMQVEIALG